MKISVIGAGAWGTTISMILSEAGHNVNLWVFERELCSLMKETRENKWYLPGFQLPVNIEFISDIKTALDSFELVVFVIPSKYLSKIAKMASKHIPKTAIILSATKGLDDSSGSRMSEILEKIFPDNKIAVISGPNLSKEIAKGLPAASVIASKRKDTAEKIQSLMMIEKFRLYSSDDVVGVELGGALKNVIAIAAGIVDGLELGDNAKAGLMVRGIVEISRLGCALGAKKETFSGLSGIGDLITTCSSKLSRNHYIGENLAKGRKLDDILKNMKEVAEGVNTTKVAVKLAKKHKVDMPITQEVFNVLFENKDPFKAISSLMKREKKSEKV